jgi:hypothetical protein
MTDVGLNVTRNRGLLLFNPTTKVILDRDCCQMLEETNGWRRTESSCICELDLMQLPGGPSRLAINYQSPSRIDVNPRRRKVSLISDVKPNRHAKRCDARQVCSNGLTQASRTHCRFVRSWKHTNSIQTHHDLYHASTSPVGYNLRLAEVAASVSTAGCPAAPPHLPCCSGLSQRPSAASSRSLPVHGTTGRSIGSRVPMCHVPRREQEPEMQKHQW